VPEQHDGRLLVFDGVWRREPGVLDQLPEASLDRCMGGVRGHAMTIPSIASRGRHRLRQAGDAFVTIHAMTDIQPQLWVDRAAAAVSSCEAAFGARPCAARPGPPTADRGPREERAFAERAFSGRRFRVDL
jgi:hypothetical protein